MFQLKHFLSFWTLNEMEPLEEMSFGHVKLHILCVRVCKRNRSNAFYLYFIPLAPLGRRSKAVGLFLFSWVF